MKNLILTISASTILTLAMVSFIGFKTPNTEPTSTAILVENESPVGAITAWSGNPAFLPSNWKVCDGTQLPKGDFKELYTIIADNWTPDTGGKKDLFRIPDLRGVF